MPAMLVFDRQGIIRYQHYGNYMSDIPNTETIIRVLDEIEH